MTKRRLGIIAAAEALILLVGVLFYGVLYKNDDNKTAVTVVTANLRPAVHETLD